MDILHCAPPLFADRLLKRVQNFTPELRYSTPRVEYIGFQKYLLSSRNHFYIILHNYNIISWNLSPGDAIAFNFKTIHGAPGNITNQKRRAFSARFTGDDAIYKKRKGETSPPFPEVTLKNGDKMDSETFPIIPL